MSDLTEGVTLRATRVAGRDVNPGDWYIGGGVLYQIYEIKLFADEVKAGRAGVVGLPVPDWRILCFPSGSQMVGADESVLVFRTADGSTPGRGRGVSNTFWHVTFHRPGTTMASHVLVVASDGATAERVARDSHGEPPPGRVTVRAMSFDAADPRVIHWWEEPT